MVPIVSKKSASNKVNTSNRAAKKPVLGLVNAPKISSNPKPRESKRGVSVKFNVPSAFFGKAGVFKPHPRELDSVGLIKLFPTLNWLSTMIAKIVEVMIPMRIDPLIFLTINTIVSKRPTVNTTIGQPTSCPPSPSSNGTAEGFELLLPHTTFGVRRTKPLSTSPISAMKSPIPTEIATLSGVGMALNTAMRNPVKTKTRMIRPSSTTSPIACAHVAFLAIDTATNVFNPSPVARARGKFATAPISIVSNPATRAVPAATIMIAFVLSPPPIKAPVLSVVAKIRGLRATM